MKFQNPSFIFFLNGRTNKRTTDKPKAICSPLFQSWGHKKNTPDTPKNNGNGLIEMIRMGKSIRHKWVKKEFILTAFYIVFSFVLLCDLYVFVMVWRVISSMDLSPSYNHFYHILSIFLPNLLA